MNLLQAIFTTSLGKKYLMAASGAVLLSFLLIHLLGNLATFLGRDVLLRYVQTLHGFTFLILIFEFLLLLALVIHLLAGGLLFIENRRARPTRYAVVPARSLRSGASRSMPLTGMITLAFLGLHLYQFRLRSGVGELPDFMLSIFADPITAAAYIIGALGIAVHTSHGFWSLFQTLGLEHPKYTPLLNSFGILFSVAVGAVFSLIPALAWLYPVFLS